MSPVSAPPTRGVIAPIRNLVGAIAENTTASGRFLVAKRSVRPSVCKKQLMENVKFAAIFFVNIPYINE